MKKVEDFSVITACGECCVGCAKKAEGRCRGCIDEDGHCQEWAESGGCPIHKCTREHGVQFCGLCAEFPCEWLVKKVVWRPNVVQELTGLAQQYREAQRAEIRTERLTLRPVTMGDLETTHAYASDLENTRYMMFLPYASLEETARAIEKAVDEWRKPEPAFCEFAIVKDGLHIGGITLYIVEDRTVGELGWVLSKDHWNRGYVTEAARAMIPYAREKWGIRRLFACCDSENEASQRVMEKLGMHCTVRDGRRTNRSMGDEARTEWVYEMPI